MLLPVVTLIILASLLQGWSNIRRMQYRKNDPNPLPRVRPTVLDAVRLAFDIRAPRILTVSTLTVALIPLGYGIAGPSAATVGFWVHAAWATTQARRVWTVRKAWRQAVFDASDFVLEFPAGASAARWVFIRTWRDRIYPGVVVVRCPDHFDAGDTQIRARLGAEWHTDAILSARYTWQFQFSPKKPGSPQWKVVCFPKDLPADGCTDPLPLLRSQERTNQLEDSPDRPTLRRLRRLRRGLVAVLRTVTPLAAIAWGVYTVAVDPVRTYTYLRTHYAVAAALATPIVLGLIWTWMRSDVLAKRDRALKPYSLALREFYGLTLWEDRWYIRLPNLALLVMAARLAMSSPSLVVALGAPAGWLALTLLRTRIVNSQRTEVAETMYAIAAANLGYDKHFKRKKHDLPVGWWQRLAIGWASTATPSRVHVSFPAGFQTTSLVAMRQFQNEWNQKAYPEGPGRDGLEWDFRANMRARVITCDPYVPANPSDVRLGELLPETWSEFLPGRLTRNGAWMKIDLTYAPHVIVTGETGSGKSATMEAMAYQKARSGWEVQIFDAGGSGGWARWEGRPGVVPAVEQGPYRCAVALAFEQIGAGFVGVREEIDRRKELLVRYKVSKWTALPEEVRPAPRLVMCDEWLSMLLSSKATGKDPGTVARKEIAIQVWGDWAYTILEGRKVGVHSITGGQRFDAKFVEGALRDNIGNRIACGGQTADGLAMMFGRSYKAPPGFVVVEGEEDSGLPKGRMLVRPGSGRPVYVVQGVWFGGENNDEDLEAYLPVEGAAPREASTSRDQPDARPDDVLDDAPAPVTTSAGSPSTAPTSSGEHGGPDDVGRPPDVDDPPAEAGDGRYAGADGDRWLEEIEPWDDPDQPPQLPVVSTTPLKAPALPRFDTVEPDGKGEQP